MAGITIVDQVTPGDIKDLKDAVVDLGEEASMYSRRMLLLTWVLVGLSIVMAVQTVLAYLSPPA